MVSKQKAIFCDGLFLEASPIQGTEWATCLDVIAALWSVGPQVQGGGPTLTSRNHRVKAIQRVISYLEKSFLCKAQTLCG